LVVSGNLLQCFEQGSTFKKKTLRLAGLITYAELP